MKTAKKNFTFSEIVGDDRNLPEPEKESSHREKPTTHLFSSKGLSSGALQF